MGFVSCNIDKFSFEVSEGGVDYDRLEIKEVFEFVGSGRVIFMYRFLFSKGVGVILIFEVMCIVVRIVIVSDDEIE